MATIYRIRFNNVEEQEIQCTLTDETGDLDIIDIQGAEDAIRIVSQDNDESKYSPIKAKKCVIKFLNSQSVNVRTFSTGEDNRWLVEVKINSLRVFIGHLEQGDIEEPFQYESNQIVVLTATDGLGLLKTHRLEDIYNAWSGSGGGCINNENRIIDYIAACLGATGLSLTINVINNLREIDNPSTDPTTFGNIYAALYLNIKTFEDQKAGQYLNCYDILDKILGHDCYLTQAKGEWWIIRVTELRQDFNMSKTIFDFDGTVLSFETLNYEKAIGLKDVNNTPFGTPDATAFFSQENTMLALQRPVKSVALTYKYENPIELLCNQAFERGTFIADLPDEVDADGVTLTVKSFTPDCWDYKKFVPPTTQDSTAYLKITYHEGFEIDRFLHAEPTVDDTFYYWTNCEIINIGLADQLSLSIPVRYGDDVAAAGYFLRTTAQLRLTADDGTFWTCHVSFPGPLAKEPGKFWQQAPDGTWTTVQQFLVWEDDADAVDFSQWNTLTYDCPPAPRSGQLEVILVNSNSPTARSKDFGPISIGYSPYIAGGYNIFGSQTDTSTRDGEYIPSIDEDVFITNAPRPILKGALLKPIGGIFGIVGLFYEGQQYSSVTGPDHLATYGELRVRAYHNQFRNGDEIYRATCQGLGEGIIDADGLDDHQDLIHRYYNRDIEPATNDQAFQLVNQDVDLRNCEWTGTLIKNFDIAIGFVSDTYTFSYGAGKTSGGGASGGGGAGSSLFVITADNGLHKDTPTNVRLGGTLVENTTIDTDVNLLAINGNNSIAGVFVTNNGGGYGIIGGTFENAGVYSSNNTVATNSIVVSLIAGASSIGTSAAGFGASIDFQLTLSDASISATNKIISQLVNAATGAAKLIFQNIAGDAFIVNPDKSIQLTPITATAASAITPAEGMMLFVSSTDGTFNSIGFWGYENGAWHKF